MTDMLASEIAHDCRVTLRTVYNWANQGVLPGAYKLGGVWRFDGAKVRAWIRSRETKPCLSIVGAKSGGSGFKPKGIASDSQLEQLLGLRR